MAALRVLVTGGSGYIGKAVLSRIAPHFEVNALMRSSRAIPVENVRVIEGDMTDADSLKYATKNIDVVVHLAAAKHDESNSYKVNVEGARALVEACKQNKVKALIVMSTASAKLPKAGLYGSTKAQADKIFSESGIPTTILRPSIVYGDVPAGVFASLSRFARWPITPVIGDGTCVFRPIHLDDLVSLTELAITNEQSRGKIYDVGGPDTISFDELVRRIAIENGNPHPRILHVPVWLGMFLAGIFSMITKHPPITTSNILGSTQEIAWDSSPLSKGFSFASRSIEEGMRSVGDACKREEAGILYRYIYSRSGMSSAASLLWKERYAKALSAHGIPHCMSSLFLLVPFLIGPVDAVTRILFPECILQARLQIATALVETDTASASWLLPQDRGFFFVIARSVLLSVSALFKIICGFFLLLIPGFIKRHAQ